MHVGNESHEPLFIHSFHGTATATATTSLSYLLFFFRFPVEPLSKFVLCFSEKLIISSLEKKEEIVQKALMVSGTRCPFVSVFGCEVVRGAAAPMGPMTYAVFI